MKKIFTGIVLALMVMLIPVGLVGCRKSPYGTFNFSTIKVSYSKDYEGEKATKSEISEQVKKLKDKKLFFKINEDGTASANLFSEDAKEVAYIWKNNGNKYSLSDVDDTDYENAEYEVTIANGTLTFIVNYISDVTVKYIFKK